MKNKRTILLFLILLAMVVLRLPAQEKDNSSLHLPEYYWSEAKALFQQDKWKEGKMVLEKGMKYYPDASPLNEQNGRYYYHYKQYDKARYYLIHALKDDPGNVTAKQLLVNVEEETLNYSSAICYVNELLEVNPYWQGLWRRKINLYRKQGNTVEANRLLKRINQIYPNDTLLRRDYNYALEENYLKQRKFNKTEAIENLKELIARGEEKTDYYLDLTNLLLQQGKTEEALEVAGQGAFRLKDVNLIKKKAGILAEQGRYNEAMTYVRENIKYRRDSSLSAYLSGLQIEAARNENLRDPYVLYGRLYQQRKSEEALTYLLNTSVTRGYNEDALYYIIEAKKKYTGEKLNKLLYKEYIVWNRMGDKRKAYQALRKCYANNPADYDITTEMLRVRLALADESLRSKDYAEALGHLDFVAGHAQDVETLEVALRKIYNCYYEQRKFKKALAVLEQINELYPMPTMQDFLKRTNTLQQLGEEPKALSELKATIDTCDKERRSLYVDAYQEIALPYIKQLQEVGARGKAYDEVKRLLALAPDVDLALRYAINITLEQENFAEAARYVKTGLSVHPKELFYPIKQAQLYQHNQEYQTAINYLEPLLIDYPANKELLGAFAENSELNALRLLKVHKSKEAMLAVDKALAFDHRNRSLLYTKGKVFEACHEYDSAYHYQKFYLPEPIEVADTRRHFNSLLYRGCKYEVETSYLGSRLAEQDIITSVATVAYRQHDRKNTYGLAVNYSGRDGDTQHSTAEYQVTGGMGVQLTPSWEHELSSSWSNYLCAGWSNKYFPRWSLNDQLTWHWKNGWDWNFGVGYRRISTYKKGFRWNETEEESAWVFDGWEERKHNLFQLTVGGDKTWNNCWFSAKAQAHLLKSRLYGNLSGQFRYFPLEDGISYVNALICVGTAPETSIIDNALPGTFDKLNALVGLSGQYLLTSHLALGLSGSWSTYYSQMNHRIGTLEDYRNYTETSYKNIYSLQVQLFIRF